MQAQNRRMNDLDNFLSLNYSSQRQPVQEMASRRVAVSPKRINQRQVPSVPLRSPNTPVGMQNSQTRELLCSNPNHRRRADFTILVEGEELLYCEKCAASAASQGFAVMRLGGAMKKSKSKQEIFLRKTPLPNYPNFKGNPLYEQILQVLRRISAIEGETGDKYTRLECTQEKYMEQIKTIEEFYNGMVETVIALRDEHLGLLINDKADSVKWSVEQTGEIKQILATLNDMRSDVENNLEMIVKEVDKATFNECMSAYRNSLSQIEQNLKETESYLKLVPEFKQVVLSRSIAEIESYIKKIWDKNPQAPVVEGRGMSIKQMHDLLPKMEHHEGKSPFRNLFDDTQIDPHAPQASPQFKMI